jgi:hypothetical protein
MQVLRCALPSKHITSNQHIDFELCGVQKVAPCDARDGEPATTRRQKTASPPRHLVEHEYQSDTLGSQYRTGARRGKGYLFSACYRDNPGARSTADTATERWWWVGGATRAEGPRQETKKAAGAATGGRAGSSARGFAFALSVSRILGCV